MLSFIAGVVVTLVVTMFVVRQVNLNKIKISNLMVRQKVAIDFVNGKLSGYSYTPFGSNEKVSVENPNLETWPVLFALAHARYAALGYKHVPFEALVADIKPAKKDAE